MGLAMKTELWRRAEELFHAALEKTPDARQLFNDNACGEDRDLRRPVELLIFQDEHGGSLLEKPVLVDVDPYWEES
jgi:hypothetical protein